jgi:hypothetical protein
MAKRKKPTIRVQFSGAALIEQLRAQARRQAQAIEQYGWRPSREDLQNLKLSVKDPVAYNVLFQAWRKAGLPAGLIQKLAGRTPANRRATARQSAAAHMEKV